MPNRIYILYTANINGSLEHCNCGPEPLGGLGRIKTFIDQFTLNHPSTICIDGGDFYNSYPFPELNEVMTRCQVLMKYDVVVTGDQEFIEGYGFFNRLRHTHDKKQLLSNVNSGKKQFLHFNHEGTDIFIESYLSPDAFTLTVKPDSIQLLEWSNSQQKQSIAASTSLDILVVHGSFNEAQQIAETNKWIDLILVAHDQRRGNYSIAGKNIVCAGKNGEYVSVIQATHAGSHWQFAVQFEKMGMEYADNPEIKKIVDKFNRNLVN